MLKKTINAWTNFRREIPTDVPKDVLEEELAQLSHVIYQEVINGSFSEIATEEEKKLSEHANIPVEHLRRALREAADNVVYEGLEMSFDEILDLAERYYDEASEIAFAQHSRNLDSDTAWSGKAHSNGGTCGTVNCGEANCIDEVYQAQGLKLEAEFERELKRLCQAILQEFVDDSSTERVSNNEQQLAKQTGISLECIHEAFSEAAGSMRDNGREVGFDEILDLAQHRYDKATRALSLYPEWHEYPDNPSNYSDPCVNRVKVNAARRDLRKAGFKDDVGLDESRVWEAVCFAEQYGDAAPELALTTRPAEQLGAALAAVWKDRRRGLVNSL